MPLYQCRRRTSLVVASSLLAHLLIPYCPQPALALREALYACPNPDAGEGVCPSNIGSTAASIASDRAAEMAEDEQTLLDLFGEAAKELLTQHVIPPTDAECRWDWRHARCEPFCQCLFQPRWGDFHLGRSCRFRDHGPGEESRPQDQDSDADFDEGAEWNGRETCHLPPDTPYAKAFQGIAFGAKTAAIKARRVGKVVAEKVHVKERFVKVKNRACTSWEERVNYDGKDMKQWQKKFCGVVESEDSVETEERQSMRRDFVRYVHQQLEDEDEPQFERTEEVPRFAHPVHLQSESEEEPQLGNPQEAPTFAHVHQQVRGGEGPPLFDKPEEAPKVEGSAEVRAQQSDESEKNRD